VFQQPDWISITVAFVVGLLAGVACMYVFRNYELRQVLRLKDELESEHRLVWQRMQRESTVGLENRVIRPKAATAPLSTET
jgi:uncharacterized membrane-anchored protein YhcB (DUF1043 family)